jgi:glycosyltransferase involved in cell wall biosynthesis
MNKLENKSLMNIIISHPTSNQNNRAAVKGLFGANMLSEFHTSIASFSGDVLDKLSGLGPFHEIARRQFDLELKELTHMSPATELVRLISSKLGLKNLTKHETGTFSIDSVYTNLDKKVASKLNKLSKQGLDAVYAYEDGAYHTFKKAKPLNLQCLYDLPIGYWRTARKLMAIEQAVWPEWAATMTGLQDSEAKLQRKDAELAMADLILVASSFTAKTLNDYQGTLAPIKVIPYGYPKPVETREYNMGSRPLKLLFVGGLSQRKGIANMFAAVENLGSRVQLTVVGHKAVADCKVLNDALLKHEWIPSLPHDQVLKLMQAHDVLLFPSLFEGFGLVITEAMSQGTPVITTDRTAGPDLIEHGHNGWLVKAGSTESLQQCIEDLLLNPEQISKAGKAARESARLRPWELYGKELSEAIIEQYTI